ncbi:hypothetical protein HDE_10800 [Halotydeus destructor]|nr:hypothetical protein HDE_10800 [Halotydeus destructor]
MPPQESVGSLVNTGSKLSLGSMAIGALIFGFLIMAGVALRYYLKTRSRNRKRMRRIEQLPNEVTSWPNVQANDARAKEQQVALNIEKSGQGKAFRFAVTTLKENDSNLQQLVNQKATSESSLATTYSNNSLYTPDLSRESVGGWTQRSDLSEDSLFLRNLQDQEKETAISPEHLPSPNTRSCDSRDTMDIWMTAKSKRSPLGGEYYSFDSAKGRSVTLERIDSPNDSLNSVETHEEEPEVSPASRSNESQVSPASQSDHSAEGSYTSVHTFDSRSPSFSSDSNDESKPSRSMAQSNIGYSAEHSRSARSSSPLTKVRSESSDLNTVSPSNEKTKSATSVTSKKLQALIDKY